MKITIDLSQQNKTKLSAALDALPFDSVRWLKDSFDDYWIERTATEELRAEQKQIAIDKFKELQALINDAGIPLNEIVTVLHPKNKKQKKQPPKYRIEGPDGSIVTWAGTGRKPKAFSAALDGGANIDDFLIADQKA